ncbi:hypothetical protein DFJ74DRAFT_102659 [Hyaloraphidium curvatum]|nr:hypothetical protein DFJ74DRAFT_102659 [Hyaloraphidium curvatum]
MADRPPITDFSAEEWRLLFPVLGPALPPVSPGASAPPGLFDDSAAELRKRDLPTRESVRRAFRDPLFRFVAAFGLSPWALDPWSPAVWATAWAVLGVSLAALAVAWNDGRFSVQAVAAGLAVQALNGASSSFIFLSVGRASSRVPDAVRLAFAPFAQLVLWLTFVGRGGGEAGKPGIEREGAGPPSLLVRHEPGDTYCPCDSKGCCGGLERSAALFVMLDGVPNVTLYIGVQTFFVWTAIGT